MTRLFYLRIAYVAAMAVCQATASAASIGQLWPSDCLTKVMRDDQPTEPAGGALLMSGARGEIVSGQAAFRPLGMGG